MTKQQPSQEEVFALPLCQQSESGRVFLHSCIQRYDPPGLFKDMDLGVGVQEEREKAENILVLVSQR